MSTPKSFLSFLKFLNISKTVAQNAVMHDTIMNQNYVETVLSRGCPFKNFKVFPLPVSRNLKDFCTFWTTLLCCSWSHFCVLCLPSWHCLVLSSITSKSKGLHFVFLHKTISSPEFQTRGPSPVKVISAILFFKNFTLLESLFSSNFISTFWRNSNVCPWVSSSLKEMKPNRAARPFIISPRSCHTVHTSRLPFPPQKLFSFTWDFKKPWHVSTEIMSKKLSLKK